MLDTEHPDENPSEASGEPAGTVSEPRDENVTAAKKAPTRATRKRAAKKAVGTGDQSGAAVPAGTPAANPPAAETPAAETSVPRTQEAGTQEAGTPEAPAKQAATKKAAAKKAATKKTATKKTAAKKAATKKTATKKTAAKKTATKEPAAPETAVVEGAAAETVATEGANAAPPPAPMLVFQPPEQTQAALAPETSAPAAATPPGPAAREQHEQTPDEKPEKDPLTDRGPDDGDSDEDADGEGSRRRRRRGGRRRRKPAGGNESEEAESSAAAASGPDQGSVADAEPDSDGSGGNRRRRRRRRTGDDPDEATEDSGKDTGGRDDRGKDTGGRDDRGKDTGGKDDRGKDTGGRAPRARRTRNAEDEITSLTGSTRLEAKKQRRREGREAGRRRAPVVSEAEFLARREAVERVMVIRQRKDLTQIAVLEDKVLVEHYVARESQTSLIGNVYLGRVQNVLPSMEAAFIDIGKGRNAVLYAGEVNWDALGAKNGGQRKIESVLKSGQPIMVQVSKDPVGHKGARLTSQVSLPGRFLVYVPDGTTSGISRKLPDTERTRLKTLLKAIVPGSAGVIVRTAAEGASEDELTLDVERLTARWADVSAKAGKGSAPQLLYGEPDLTLKVVRDLFTEDFDKLVVAGDQAWGLVDEYVEQMAPDLGDRLERYDGDRDVFAEYRIDEQIAKGLDRKVWLPSGGSLVIDRTEAMTVVDVNTGKFTGSGGNLEETVTRNNLEAAEETVRQLRLRDIGGIIVVDFIDMVLESNRDLVLRRMVECLGRDRTRHQVAEVTSLGLVQMTRKRIGTGLLEAFSESCTQCQGRGVVVHPEPVDNTPRGEDEPRRSRRGGRGRDDESGGRPAHVAATPTPRDVAAVASAKNADKPPLDEVVPVAPEPDQPVDVPPEAASAEAARQPEPATAPVRPQPPDAAPPTPVRARKRSARRVQGPASNAPDEAGAGVLVLAREPADHTPEQPAQEDPAPLADQPPAPPRVLTSVRRRGSASRAAGPPSSPDGHQA